MGTSTSLFAGLFGSFVVSTVALVIIPQSQLGGLQQHYVDDEGKPTNIYPIENEGVALQGREVYIREGCFTCHSQQVRDSQNGLDIERGWGPRRTVARDYLFSSPALLGQSRLGPDLTNAGTPAWRNEAIDEDRRRPTKRDIAWYLLHMYDPAIIISESNCAPMRYLFDERKISGQGSSDALRLPVLKAPDRGMEVVPTPAAFALAGYLTSLDRTAELAEAKAPPAAGIAPAAAAAPAP